MNSSRKAVQNIWFSLFRVAAVLNGAALLIIIYFIENRVTALIGPSGCGKSTPLRCLTA